MRDKVNKYGPVVISTIKLGQLHKEIKTTDDLVFYGYYEYTGLRNFWKKVRMVTKIKSNEYNS